MSRRPQVPTGSPADDLKSDTEPENDTLPPGASVAVMVLVAMPTPTKQAVPMSESKHSCISRRWEGHTRPKLLLRDIVIGVAEAPIGVEVEDVHEI